MVEVTEHVEGSHRRVSDDVVHIVRKDAGHPLEGRLAEVSVGAVELRCLLDEGELIE